MTAKGSLAEFRLLGNEPAISAIRALSWAEAPADPGPVVRVRQIERRVPPKAAMALSGSRIDGAYDRLWVGSGQSTSGRTIASAALL
jgi:hypothetical protein